MHPSKRVRSDDGQMTIETTDGKSFTLSRFILEPSIVLSDYEYSHMEIPVSSEIFVYVAEFLTTHSFDPLALNTRVIKPITRSLYETSVQRVYQIFVDRIMGKLAIEKVIELLKLAGSLYIVPLVDLIIVKMTLDILSMPVSDVERTFKLNNF